MLSKKSKYALKALFALARQKDDHPLGVTFLSESERIPKKFLEMIMIRLKNEGYVKSVRGKSGGYLLARKPEEIMLGSIIRSFDGPLAPVRCASVTLYQRCEECIDEQACEIHHSMKKVRDAIAQVLDNTSLADGIHHHGQISNLEI